MKIFNIILVAMVSVSCDKVQEGSSCDSLGLKEQITTSLNSITTDSDFSFFVERDNGDNISYDRGSSTLGSIYESASTSKWVSSAIILWVLENRSSFNLSDKPSDHFAWTMPSGDPLYNSTLTQLLSFTSGLREEANCLKLGLPAKSFSNCINDLTGSIVSENKANGQTPGTGFYYSSSHLQIAGAMAVGASLESSWQDLFTAFKSANNLFSNSSYSLPSLSNPRLAGGMTWSGNDYVGFLRAIYKNKIFSLSTRNLMFQDYTGTLGIDYSPAFVGLGEQWHYGLGVWLECPSSSFDCSEIEYYSSPGAYGAYPFLNLNKKFFGLVARQGALGTFTKGVNIYRSVSSLVEDWAVCSD